MTWPWMRYSGLLGLLGCRLLDARRPDSPPIAPANTPSDDTSIGGIRGRPSARMRLRAAAACVSSHVTSAQSIAPRSWRGWRRRSGCGRGRVPGMSRTSSAAVRMGASRRHSCGSARACGYGGAMRCGLAHGLAGATGLQGYMGESGLVLRSVGDLAVSPVGWAGTNCGAKARRAACEAARVKSRIV
eukprot:359264-Chlamydomonas_euryale.AAC.4